MTKESFTIFDTYSVFPYIITGGVVGQDFLGGATQSI